MQTESHHCKEQANSETLERWQAYRKNGETVSNKAMMDWLDSWGTEQEVPCPVSPEAQTGGD